MFPNFAWTTVPLTCLTCLTSEKEKNIVEKCRNKIRTFDDIVGGVEDEEGEFRKPTCAAVVWFSWEWTKNHVKNPDFESEPLIQMKSELKCFFFCDSVAE